MQKFARAALCGLALLLASCGSIGEGSTVQSFKLVFSPSERDQAAAVDVDLPTQHVRMFDCFCSNLTLIGTFTDGTLANFNSRAHWTTSDPSIATVLNYLDTDTVCPLAQVTAGMVEPHAPGTAVISAEYLGRTSSYTVDVADTAAEAAGSFVLKPTDATNAGEVAVGAVLPMGLYVTLDGHERNVDLNVMNFSFEPAADTVATIDTIGRIFAHSADGGTPLNAKATFNACSVATTAPVRVGEVVAPMAIAEEAGFASDQRLAVNSNEILQVTAALDFDGDGAADGSQDLSDQVLADFTDPCTLREFDGTVPTTNCKETATPACASNVPVCPASTDTLCTTGMAACRTVAAPMLGSGGNRIIATAASTSPTTLFATFPGFVALPTTLGAAIGAGDTSLTVATVAAYPVVFPWEAVLDKGTASEEIVQVTAATGTTLTVVRAYAGTTAQAHASGAAFAQRTFGSDTVDITATDGTLTDFTIDSTPSTLATYATVQLQATGTYQDTAAMTSRSQRVSHVTTFAVGSPGMIWTSSNPAVAFVAAGFGTVTSLSSCGGTAVIRARANTSTNTDDAAFAVPDTAAAGADDLDGNGNTDANDTACTTTDPLCDQVTLTVPPASPLPPGAVCP